MPAPLATRTGHATEEVRFCFPLPRFRCSFKHSIVPWQKGEGAATR
jgi:hypothetical protein